MKGRLLESLDSFGEEGEAAPRLSIVEWPAGQDPLAEFSAEETIRTVPPPQRVVPFATPDTLRSVPAPVERAPRIERISRTSSTPRTVFALAALASVAAISVWTLNALSTGGALEAPLPTDVVAADRPAPLPRTPAAVTPPPASPPAIAREFTTAKPLTEAPRAETRRSDTRTAETRTTERRSAAQTVSKPPTTAAERVSEPRRPIDVPTTDRPQVQAVVPAPAPARGVDTVPTSAPPATATTGVRPTESGQGPRPDPPAVAVPGAAVSAPAVVIPPPTAAAAAATAPPAPPAPAPPAARVVTPTAAIQSVLGRYAAAFSALDARGAKAVWPSVNERNLARAFENLEEQEFDLGACAITVTAPRAVASCRGTARYTPKVGNRNMRTESRQWMFRLEANGDTWSIASVESR